MKTVYLMSGPAGAYKIGHSADVQARAKSLCDGTPYQTEVLHCVETPHALLAERLLHERFAGSRIRGEWYSLRPEDIAWVRSLNAEAIDELVTFAESVLIEKRGASRSPIVDTFARVLRAELDRRGWTASELARRSGVSQPVLSRYLTGDREPLLSTAAQLADALGLSLDALAGRDLPRRRRA